MKRNILVIVLFAMCYLINAQTKYSVYLKPQYEETDKEQENLYQLIYDKLASSEDIIMIKEPQDSPFFFLRVFMLRQETLEVIVYSYILTVVYDDTDVYISSGVGYAGVSKIYEASISIYLDVKKIIRDITK